MSAHNLGFYEELGITFIKFHQIRTLFEPHHEKTGFCKLENKDADQLRGNRDADQRLCFRYKDSTTSLLPESEISKP